MTFDKQQAQAAAELNCDRLRELAAKLNRRRYVLAAQGWKGEGIYSWLCLVAGRWLRRHFPGKSPDPAWRVSGWGIGRGSEGPMIYFDITDDCVKVDPRAGAKAWETENRI